MENIIILLITLVVLMGLWLLLLFKVNHKQILTSNTSEYAEFTLVFGAGFEKDGSPSPMLVDRLNTAYDLYHLRKTDFIIVSAGIHDNNNEAENMYWYLIKKGISSDEILVDEKGNNTEKSIQNAIPFMDKTEKIHFISQRFHLTRISIIAKAFGITPSLIQADRRIYALCEMMYLYVREIFAIMFFYFIYFLSNRKA